MRPGDAGDVCNSPRTPVVVIEPHGQIAEGSRVTLTCSTDANPPPQTYSWYKGTIPLSNRDKVLTFTVGAEHSGKYTCQVTNTYGHSRSHYKELHVTYGPRIPVIVIDPPGQIVAGCLVNLTCSTDANPPPHTYSWYKREGTIQVNYREKVLTFSNVRSEDSGNYSCQATNTYGSNTSPNTEIHVLYGPRTPVVVIDPPGNITEGSRVTLTCSSDANPPVESYTWFKVSTAVSITVEGISASGEQSPLVTAVVVVSVCGVVGLLCMLVWLRQMKRRQEPGGQDQHYFSVTGQSTAAEDAGGAEDAGHYSTVQPHGSRQTSGGAEDAGHYSTVQPHGSRQTAGAQEDDVQYSSVQFKAGLQRVPLFSQKGSPLPSTAVCSQEWITLWSTAVFSPEASSKGETPLTQKG
ncbi:hypothetical protein AALO_G00094830 [Alosa alosa]|uniref:Ig-like domain-containing protein n=1 Tax=Alosa alosa TaxID=278164 RepID=A0AAV6GSD8_9TELE|nr:hypothetical protein AALO_G00094830 [Alosa alosa]